MNKKVMSHLIGICLLLTVLALLVGCRPGEVEQAAASNTVSSNETSATAIDPADRKFYSGGYVANSAAPNSPNPLANIEPADRKFFNSGYVAASTLLRNPEVPAGIEPADRKFFINNYLGLGGDDPLAHVHPADRKFFNIK